MRHILYRVRRGGHLARIPDVNRNPTALKQYLTSQRNRRIASPPTLYIVPEEPITHRPLGTPTVHLYHLYCNFLTHHHGQSVYTI